MWTRCSTSGIGKPGNRAPQAGRGGQKGLDKEKAGQRVSNENQ